MRVVHVLVPSIVSVPSSCRTEPRETIFGTEGHGGAFASTPRCGNAPEDLVAPPIGAIVILVADVVVSNVCSVPTPPVPRAIIIRTRARDYVGLGDVEGLGVLLAGLCRGKVRSVDTKNKTEACGRKSGEDRHSQKLQ